MTIQLRTMFAYLLLMIGFLVSVPWCVGIAWIVFRGVADLAGFLFTVV